MRSLIVSEFVTRERSRSAMRMSEGSGCISLRALVEAGNRQVIVTRTVRDLATGIDLVFTPLGWVGLRVVPGEWELFEATIS